MGDVTATFYDAPIVQAAIGLSFMQTGKVRERDIIGLKLMHE